MTGAVPETFTVRTVHAADGRMESAAYDMIPALPQGQTVCSLFAEFLASQPGEFDAKLPFLNKVEVEMQWAAAGGGSAFYAFLHGGEPLGMGVLLSGATEESDGSMLESFRAALLDAVTDGRSAAVVEDADRPLAVLVQFPDRPELMPTLQLLTTALASVYFRVVAQLHGGERQS